MIGHPTDAPGGDNVDFKLELVVVPVSDVDRAKAFYAGKMGFTVDVDHAPNEHFRVVQLTPPGSACSITIGTGLSKSEPGSYQGLHLVVTDIEAARAWLVERGVEASEPFHFGPEGQTPGVDPKHGDYSSFLSVSDPDGNGWLVQEVKYQAR
jgi:catechol 2,3-dioxygenase-like lactoylglutathione lyase family enzyme